GPIVGCPPGRVGERSRELSHPLSRVVGMSKARSIFRCAECGGASPKWAGRCPSCAEWNTLVEELDVPTPVASSLAAAIDRPVPIAEVDTDEWQPRSTGLSEVDRVLSGGLVPGSVTL